MKYLKLLPIGLVGFALATPSCSQDNLDPNGTGATGAGATGGAAGSGSPTGGTAGGSTTGGVGGASGGVGGAGGSAGSGTTTGGAGGTSGAGSSVGGAAGTGTTTGGSAGTGTTVGGGAGAASVGGAAGTGAGGGAGTGAGGSGGDPAGGSAGSGMAGTGTAGTGSDPLDPRVLVPDIDGFYWEGTCKGTSDGHNCLVQTGACPSTGTFYDQGINITKSFKVHGTAGVKYTLNVEIRGVAGGRCYTGGTPGTTAGADLEGATNNGWYTGGKQLNDSIWNTYEVHVSDPPVDGAANIYFANSVQPVANPDAFPSGTGNNCQMEMTIAYNYTASFPVMGDSTVEFLIHDSNCKGQQNCSRTASTATCEPRTVSLTGMTPAATFTQPVSNAVGTATLYPQWLYFDVKTITSP